MNRPGDDSEPSILPAALVQAWQRRLASARAGAASVSAWALRLLPFLAWFPINAVILRGDAIAGITGALVLVPKAMAYAQLAGLPVQYGLYVAFVPAILGALWGSSRQLATGPVAILSLMTAAALTPLAEPQSAAYIELALLLTLMVGIIQFTLGAIKLGTIVNFVSHPVILGFMNAAAVIIALSQIELLLGIALPRTGSFLGDMRQVFTHLDQTHWPTLAMAVFSLVLLLLLQRKPRIAKLSMLIAVGVTTLASALLGYERSDRVALDRLADPRVRELAHAWATTDRDLRELQARIVLVGAELRKVEDSDPRAAATLRQQLELLRIDADDASAANTRRWQTLLRTPLVRGAVEGEAAPPLYAARALPEGVTATGGVWRIKKIADGELHLAGGGDVVGQVPQGLPELRVPSITLDGLLSLLSVAFVIALVGFTESIAMAKALAVKAQQRLNPNQELIGQGVANLGGALFQAYPACGSFTGSAINLQAGARTGFAMVFNGLFVAATLLLLTPLLYHLPKATLGVIVVLAVFSLFTPAALLHTWRASRSDGMVALVTAVVTLVSAPALEVGILTGAGLAALLYLLRTMEPRVAELARHPDGTLRDTKVFPDLPTTPELIALRFDDALFFANAAFFEEAVLDALARKPQAKYLLIVGGAINQIDASGEDVVRLLVQRLRANGVTVVFSGLKKQVLDVFRRTGLDKLIGPEHFFGTEDQALAAIYRWLGREGEGELQLTRPMVP